MYIKHTCDEILQPDDQVNVYGQIEDGEYICSGKHLYSLEEMGRCWTSLGFLLKR